MRIKTFINLIGLLSLYSVAAQNSYNLALDLKTQPTENYTFSQTGISGSFSSVLKSKYKITNTLKYTAVTATYHNLDNEFSENLKEFKGIENEIQLAYLLSHTTELYFSAKPVLYYQEKPTVDAFSLLGGLELAYALNPKSKIRLGITKTTSFGSPQWLPTLSWSQEWNKKTLVVLGFPESKISYTNNSRNLFQITNTFNGSYYNLKQPLPLTAAPATKASFSQISTALEYERNIETNWFVTLKGGFECNRKYSLLDDTFKKTSDLKISDGYTLGIAIKYKH